jgi:hypothetical protein
MTTRTPMTMAMVPARPNAKPTNGTTTNTRTATPTITPMMSRVGKMARAAATAAVAARSVARSSRFTGLFERRPAHARRQSLGCVIPPPASLVGGPKWDARFGTRLTYLQTVFLEDRTEDRTRSRKGTDRPNNDMDCMASSCGRWLTRPSCARQADRSPRLPGVNNGVELVAAVYPGPIDPARPQDVAKGIIWHHAQWAASAIVSGVSWRGRIARSSHERFGLGRLPTAERHAAAWKRSTDLSAAMATRSRPWAFAV